MNMSSKDRTAQPRAATKHLPEGQHVIKHVGNERRRSTYLAVFLIAVLAFTTMLSSMHIETAHAQAIDDREALEAIYDATDGLNWTDNTGWLGGGDHCNWFGIECNAQGRVTYLTLAENNLTGEIPPELGDLQSLHSLWIADNPGLRGEIPLEITNLNRLEVVGLFDNGLVGEIPPELGTMTNLISLFLSGNDLVGEIPPELGNLTELHGMQLGDNDLVGEIPPELGNLSQISFFQIGNTDIGGEIPPELANLASVEHLRLAGNELSGEIPPELANLDTLESLHLQGNNLSGEIPSELGNLRNLEALWLSANDLTGEIPLALANLTELDSLLLDRNSLAGEIPSQFGEITNLTDLITIELRGNGCLTASPRTADRLASVPFNDMDEALCAVQQTHGGAVWESDAERIAVASNIAGDVAIIAVQTNGDLWARRGTSNALTDWQLVGRGADAADIALDDSGNAEIVIISHGSMITRTWFANGALSDSQSHGRDDWATAQPSIATNGSDVVIAAVKSNGRLFTRLRSNDVWQSFQRHGAPTWAQSDVALTSSGEIYLVGTKTDGRLFTRHTTDQEWFDYSRHGASTWQPSVAPSIEATTDGAVFAAVKEDGRLFTRELLGATWQEFQRHGGFGWQSVSIDLTPSRSINVAAIKADGRLFSRQFRDRWQAWTQFAPETSWSGKPAVTNTDQTTVVFAATTAQMLHTFTMTD